MRRELPARPHLDHLKKQAKDLLSAHRKGDAEAMARLRDAVPAFARLSLEEMRRAEVALHDAQSAIAREYGFASWNELRAEVAKRAGKPFPEAMIRAIWNQPLPDAVMAAVRETWSRRPEAASALAVEPRPSLPLVALRNAFLLPGSIAPIHIGRPVSVAAVDAALAGSPATFAMFSQRAPETEAVTAEALHPIGVEVLVHKRIDAGPTGAFVVLEALRWLSLVSVSDGAGYQIAEVAPVRVDAEDAAGEVPALFEAVRERAREAAAALPEAERAIEMVDEIEDPERLADLVTANLPCPVEDKARYAAEPSLAGRLRMVIAFLDGAASAAK